MSAMPVAKRYGDAMLTWSGRQFWPLDPRPEEIFLEDIATGLSNECRYGGQVIPHFSVAQHSVLVAMNLPASLRRQGLMHDATEAYLKDIPRPIKKWLRDYSTHEARMARCIGRRFDIQLEFLDVLTHQADERALATERRDLFPPREGIVLDKIAHGGFVQPWLAKISPWTHEEARKAFLGMAHELGIREVA